MCASAMYMCVCLLFIYSCEHRKSRAKLISCRVCEPTANCAPQLNRARCNIQSAVVLISSLSVIVFCCCRFDLLHCVHTCLVFMCDFIATGLPLLLHVLHLRLLRRLLLLLLSGQRGERHVDVVRRSAPVAGHVGEPREIGVALLVGQAGGAPRLEQPDLLQANLQLERFLHTHKYGQNTIKMLVYVAGDGSPTTTHDNREH